MKYGFLQKFDVGVFIFFILVPLLYPLLYAFIYTNEVVREVPVAVVDLSGTACSRDYLRRLDATPDVRIATHCTDMAEARRLVQAREVLGVVCVPHGFASGIARGEQVAVSAYADMSGMLYFKSILAANIDECFMDLDGIPDVAAFGRELAARVEQWTGIPVSVGVASTKTLAKVASKFAKKYPGYHHCCVIDNEEKRERALRLMPVADVWGVGRRMRDTLHRMGIRTAYDYAALSPERVRRLFALPAVHTLLELRGHKCIPLELPAAKRSITSSRSFKTPIYDFETLRAVVVDFASMCAAKLRREGSAARCVTTYIRTDRFRPDLPQYAQAAAVQLDVASSDLRELSAAAAQALQAIFRTGYGYKKAAVMLTRIDTVDRRRQSRLLRAVDAIHRRLGPDALRVASQQSHASVMNHEHRSPNYTTSLADIIEVK